MGSQITLQIDLFCAGCSTALTVEESDGHHILIEPCQRCVQSITQRVADEKRVEEQLSNPAKKEDGKEKLRKWEEDAERRKKALVNVKRMMDGDTE